MQPRKHNHLRTWDSEMQERFIGKQMQPMAHYLNLEVRMRMDSSSTPGPQHPQEQPDTLHQFTAARLVQETDCFPQHSERLKQNSSDPAPIDLAHESMAAEGLEVCAVVLSEHDPVPEDERTVSEQMPKASPSPDMSDPLSEFYYENLVAMKALSPDIIRGIPVYRALKVLQSIWFHGDFRQQFSFAQVVQEFDEFWSHSWKTRPFLKYACVLYLNNTMPAFLLGLLFAVVAAILFVAGILPAFVDFRKTVDCYWCTPAGIIGYYACLLLSARCKSVFLDVACIDQADPLRKAAGLVSLGAFLRSSKRMLVLWDESLSMPRWHGASYPTRSRMRLLLMIDGRNLAACPASRFSLRRMLLHRPPCRR